MADVDFERRKFPVEREIVVDAGYLGTGRHMIYALLEVDITTARSLIAELSAAMGEKISFTAFIVASFARAVEKYPQVAALLDWRRRLVTFHQVDVVTMIEPRPGAVAVPHIIRAANRKTVMQISQEIRSIQSHPGTSPQVGRLTRLAPHLPRFLRLWFFRLLKLNPPWFKKMSGTVVLTSVGMFGKGGGWGIGFVAVHTMGLTVGGISHKPDLVEGELVLREHLHLTLSFDHDVIDGAPAARFASALAELIETAALLTIESAQLSK